MRRLLVLATVALIALTGALLVGAAWLALARTEINPDALRGPLALFALAGTAVFALAAFAFFRLVDRRYYAAAAALARDLRSLLESRALDRGLRIPAQHGLGDLPAALASLVDALRAARRETVRAMATATARTEQEKGWLELILLELVPQAVVVCNLEHRILLYNQAAGQLFRGNQAMGLGRSLVDLVTAEPVRHSLEGLELRHKSGRRDLSAAFVCASRDAAHMLQGRMALILDAARSVTGYALSLEDISAELEGRHAGERLRRTLVDARGPVANLRAAAEIVATQPDLDSAQRQAFDEVLHKESERLSELIDQLSGTAETQAAASWPMVQIHSPDLFNLVAHRLHTDAGITLAVAGAAHWLIGDSHLLMLALCDLAAAVAAHAHVSELEIEAGQVGHRSYIELRWAGKAASTAVIDTWLGEPLRQLPDTSVRDVLERHGAEPWSQAAGAPGRHALHIPLQTAEAPEQAHAVAPAHPELYDFDLMYAQSFTGDLGERRLKDLAYVVFDTETTGLRPTAGDEMISIAAVRVTQGRVLEGEVFDQLVNPGRPIPRDSIRFHGITDDMVREQPPITAVLPRFREFAGDAVLVAHNAAFDMKFIKLKEAQCGVDFDNPVIDTLLLALLVEGPDEDLTLDGLSERAGVEIVDRHSARGDTLATAHVLVHLLDRLEARGLHTFRDVMHATGMEEALRLRAQHF